MANSYTEDEIDQLYTLPQVLKTFKKNKLRTKGLEDIYALKSLLKYELISKDTVTGGAATFLAAEHLDDRQQREDLSKIFDDVNKFAEQLTKTQGVDVSDLNNEFPNICNKLVSVQEKMMKSVPSVLVLGESGSGKSSFINLLLGDSYFPSSILSTTHVICEIRYGEIPKAILYKAENNDEVKISTEDSTKFKEDLKLHTQMVTKDGKAVYRLAEVYLDCKILQKGLVIVDSPGIGESKEMNDIVKNYILNASVFLYIIDSTNAGGMLERVSKLVKKVYKKALLTPNICRPDSALFICNKWDDVKMNEREDVLQNTRDKIRLAWPNCTDDQIICFSTREADFIQGRGRMAPKFQDILKKIGQLIGVGQDILVLRAHREASGYIDRCIHHFDSHLSQLDMSKEERIKKFDRTTNRLNQLKANVTNFFDKQKKIVQKNIGSIAKSLSEYINKPESRRHVCGFSSHDLPKRQGWDNAAVEIRSKVYNSLKSLINNWEMQEKPFASLIDDIENEFKKFPDFELQLYNAEREMSGPGNNDDDVIPETEINLLPDFIQDRMSGLKMGTKVALGIGLSPVILVGFVVRLSVVGAQSLKRVIAKISMESDYKAAGNDEDKLKKVCQKYAEKTIDSITGKMNLKTIIEEKLQPLYVYLKQQQDRMECQIFSDIKLLKTLQLEDREDEYISKVYEPLRSKCLIVQQCLHFFLLEHMPSQIKSWMNVLPTNTVTSSENTVCSGLTSYLVHATCSHSTTVKKVGTRKDDGKDVYARVPDGHIPVSIIYVREKLARSKMITYLQKMEAHSMIVHPNIVQCFGFWRNTENPRLNPVVESLRCSLRKRVKKEDFIFNYENNCVNMMKQLVEGLKYLHDKKLVHLDLSLDSVAVNYDNKIKLTNISPSVKLNIEPTIVNDQVCLSSYIHLAPKFFQNNNTEQYTSSADIFSVGIIMFELWIRQGLVAIGEYHDIPKSVVKNRRTTGNADNVLESSMEVTIKSVYQRSSFKANQVTFGKCSKFSSSLGDHRDDNDDTGGGVAVGEDQVSGRRKGGDYDEDSQRWFQSFLKEHQPNLRNFKTSENRRLPELWKKTIQDCLYSDPTMTAASWLDMWQGYHVFPDVSLVSNDNF
ncbi:hypothetical protein ACF0H5_005468 [Mactra antiquata]